MFTQLARWKQGARRPALGPSVSGAGASQPALNRPSSKAPRAPALANGTATGFGDPLPRSKRGCARALRIESNEKTTFMSTIQKITCPGDLGSRSSPWKSSTPIMCQISVVEPEDRLEKYQHHQCEQVVDAQELHALSSRGSGRPPTPLTT